jgi:hypothetical protein
VQDTLLYSARLDLGASRMLLQPDRLLVASEQGRVLAFDATHPRTPDRGPVADPGQQQPAAHGRWLGSDPPGRGTAADE